MPIAHARTPPWLEPMAATLTADRFVDAAWIFDGEATGAWGRQGTADYHVFDVLWLDGKLVTSLPIEERKALLARVPFRRPVARVTPLGVTGEAPWDRACREAIAQVDAVLFVTPEYNRSVPGALKNAIDWASRPYGKNAFTRKPSAVIGASTGKIGTAVAQQHLRSILAFCNSPLMNSVEAYIQFEPGLITRDGEVTNASTRDFLRNFMAEFHVFITRVYTVLPRPAEPVVL